MVGCNCRRLERGHTVVETPQGEHEPWCDVVKEGKVQESSKKVCKACGGKGYVVVGGCGTGIKTEDCKCKKEFIINN